MGTNPFSLYKNVHVCSELSEFIKQSFGHHEERVAIVLFRRCRRRRRRRLLPHYSNDAIVLCSLNNEQRQYELTTDLVTN